MKIAVSGKGGTGKTTLAGVMARVLSERGLKVLAIDADPDSNLASAIGMAPETLNGVQPLAQMPEFIEERTGTRKGTYGSFFKLNPRVDDIPERFSLQKENIKLMILGSIPQGGGGCFCAENVLLKSLIAHVLIERDEWVIVDMEAGLEHLGRGSTAYMDALIVVVEPGLRSIQTAHQVKKLSDDLGIRRVYAVGNKITGEGDRKLLEENLKGLPVLGVMRHSGRIVEADKLGVSPYDLDPELRSEVEEIIDSLQREAR
jgi:CO dehydrogenase maturation factor